MFSYYDKTEEVSQPECDHAQGAQHLRAPGGQGEGDQEAVVEPVPGEVAGAGEAVRPHRQDHTAGQQDTGCRSELGNLNLVVC